MNRFFQIIHLLFFAIFLNAMALPSLGASIQEGLDALDKKEFEIAAAQFSDVFKAGDGDGAFYLGRMLELGLGGDANPAGSLLMYKAGAKKDSAKSLNRLGLMHFRGELGVLQDFAKAREHMCNSAKLNDKDGLFNCAEMQIEGKGGEKNIEQAISNYTKAATQGHIGAANILAIRYRDGKDVEKNIEMAYKYFSMTAEKGNPIGLYELGKIYEANDEGSIVEQDLVKAHMYYNLANARQHPQAATNLQNISTKLETDKMLSAQEMARDWAPKE